LFGVTGVHPIALSATLGLFVLMVVVAMLIPLRRVLRMQPTSALRHE
jgi:ABC-type antimicrobial peptide transport system permease subunit